MVRVGRGDLRDGEKGVLTPLNPIHFKPTSLINSAVFTLCSFSFDPSVAKLYNSVSPSGEFIVIVAAVYIRSVSFWRKNAI